MNNIFVRIVLIMFAVFGVYKMFPQVSKPVDYYIKNPKFQNSVVAPAINTANQVLPEKIQIPTPQVMGSYTDNPENSPLKQLTDEVSSKAAEIASDQLEQIRKSASDQFCKVLLEKVKSDCGIQ